MSAQSPPTRETVRHLAALAGLQPGDDRIAALTGLLGTWFPAAEALNARMRAEDLNDLAPVAVFGHAPAGGSGRG